MAADIVWHRSHSACVGLIGDAHLADAGRVSEQVVCLECGSASLVSSGVFEHGTWTHRLTCWTCRDCRTVFTVPAAEALGLDAEDVIAADDGFSAVFELDNHLLGERFQGDDASLSTSSDDLRADGGEFALECQVGVILVP